MGQTVEIEAIWRDFSERLLGYLRRHVANREDAEDVLQQVMLNIQLRAGDLASVTSISGWVWALTRNALVDHHRRTGRQPTRVPLRDDDVWSDDAVPADEDLRHELAACLQPLMQQLSPRLRASLTLVELEGLTHREAALRQGISVSGCKSRVQRARRQLRTLLERCCRLTVDGRGRPIEALTRSQCRC